jgi:DNA-binding NarL/FixJ family response regulator
MAVVRILVVDDHEIVRRRLSSLLQSRPEFYVVAEASDGFQAVEKSKDLQPDVVVLDISMPGMSGLEAAPRIRRVAPATEILFVSQHDTGSMVREALSTGARGYVLKSDAGTDLVNAVLAVSQQKEFLSHKLTHESPGSSPSASG